MSKTSYSGYSEWKGWSEFFIVQSHEQRLFEREFQGVEFAGAAHLDVGFGSGTLLAWSRQQGAQIEGFEIQSDLIAAARSKGVTVYSSLESIADQRFDLVTLFDVLEHVPQVELPGFIQALARICKPGAKIIARVPNCQSPVGLVNQFGDPTHVSMLSGPILGWHFGVAGLKVIDMREALDLVFPGGYSKRILKPLQRLVRQLSKLVYRLIWSTGDTPLSMNVIVVAQKSA